VYRATAAPSDPPSAELAALAEKFRAAAARTSVSVGAAKPPGQSDSAEDSFTTANLSNNSILDSDFHDNSSILTPVAVNPPLPPTPPTPVSVAVSMGAGNWSADLLGSLGNDTGIESMETSKTQTSLGAGYHQCKVARRGRVCKEVFDISVETVLFVFVIIWSINHFLLFCTLVALLII
jgi:hypothetical protein